MHLCSMFVSTKIRGLIVPISTNNFCNKNPDHNPFKFNNNNKNTVCLIPSPTRIFVHHFICNEAIVAIFFKNILCFL